MFWQHCESLYKKRATLRLVPRCGRVPRRRGASRPAVQSAVIVSLKQ